MGPTWGWQDPGETHVGPMILAIWDRTQMLDASEGDVKTWSMFNSSWFTFLLIFVLHPKWIKKKFRTCHIYQLYCKMCISEHCFFLRIHSIQYWHMDKYCLFPHSEFRWTCWVDILHFIYATKWTPGDIEQVPVDDMHWLISPVCQLVEVRETYQCFSFRWSCSTWLD